MSLPGLTASEHPSPHRAKVGLASLLYGLMAGPLAWAASQIINAAVGQDWAQAG